MFMKPVQVHHRMRPQLYFCTGAYRIRSYVLFKFCGSTVVQLVDYDYI